MVKVLDCSLEVSEFEHKSRYYVHFQTNNLSKDMNPLNTRPVMTKTESLLFFFYNEGFGIK